MKIFHKGEQAYHLYHNDDDDARYVRQVGGQGYLIKIDSSLRVTDAAHKPLGTISSNAANNWELRLVDGTRIDLGVGVDDYSWRALLSAEVVALQHLL